MNISQHEFQFVGDIVLAREADGSVRQFMPQARYKNTRNLPLNKYGAGPFCKFKTTNRLPVSGVYAFEAVVVRHPQLFSSEAVRRSEARIANWLAR